MDERADAGRLFGIPSLARSTPPSLYAMPDMSPAAMSARSARTLLRDVMNLYHTDSLYAIAHIVGLHHRTVQRYYQRDAMPRSARLLFSTILENPRYQVVETSTRRASAAA